MRWLLLRSSFSVPSSSSHSLLLPCLPTSFIVCTGMTKTLRKANQASACNRERSTQASNAWQYAWQSVSTDCDFSCLSFISPRGCYRPVSRALPVNHVIVLHITIYKYCGMVLLCLQGAVCWQFQGNLKTNVAFNESKKSLLESSICEPVS